MVGLGISMLLIGALLYVTLHFVVGLPFALVFSVLSALAETVPYIGALASGVPPVAFALTISPGTAVEVLAIYVAVHQVEANVIGPLVMSRAVHLHPAVIAFGVVAVGEVFGFLGLLVAVPILSLTTVLIDELWVRRRDAG
jgi:predicted PurR-regulated permease PerM